MYIDRDYSPVIILGTCLLSRSSWFDSASRSFFPALCLLPVLGGFRTRLCLIPTTPAEVPPYAASARSIAQIQESNHSRGQQPSPRADRRHPRLGAAATARPTDSSGKVEDRCRPAASFARHPRRYAVNGYAQAHLPRGGRPDPILRPCALLVRADRDTAGHRTSLLSRTSPS